MEKSEYMLIERDGCEHWCVQVVDGKYYGALFTYETVNLSPPEGSTWSDLENESVDIYPVLSYTYDLIDMPVGYDDNFENYVGDILVDLLNDSFDKGDYKIGDKDAGESGNNNPEESN